MCAAPRAQAPRPLLVVTLRVQTWVDARCLSRTPVRQWPPPPNPSAEVFRLSSANANGGFDSHVSKVGSGKSELQVAALAGQPTLSPQPRSSSKVM